MSDRPTLVDAYPYPANEDHWRSMAADDVNHFWFTNRESRVLFAEIDRLRAERDRLRKALEALIGGATRDELEQIEFGLRLVPAPDDDKTVSLNAIHALLALLDAPTETP
jgi:hypothetical protein